MDDGAATWRNGMWLRPGHVKHASRHRQSFSMTKRKKSPYTVFLSHSGRDIWLANTIAEKIRAAKIGVWIDQMSLAGGDTIIDAIIQGMKRADEAVVLVSNDSIRSQWVAVEIGIAFALRIRIAPLLNNIAHDAMAPLKGIKSYELNQFASLLREMTKRKRNR